jgi:predicted nucleic acid-binding protein
VGRSLILETTFLVDLEREERRREPGHAIAFLEREPDARLYLPFTAAGELAGGLSSRDRQKWEAFLAPLYMLASTPDVCWHYGRTYHHLRDNGSLIGANDLWIAATALAYDMPLLTRNVDHFRRVPGLDVETY